MPPVRSERTEVFRSAAVLGAMTLASRILGMARDIICASVFGAGLVMDAFTIAFIIPNLFRRLFGEGALASSFIPVYAETLAKEGEARAREFSSRLIGIQALVLGVLAVLGGGAALLVPVLLGPGPDGKLGLTCGLTAFMIPYMPLVCTCAFLSALLNARKKFALPAAAPIVLNILWIAGAVAAIPLGGGSKGAFIMASFILAGGIAETAMLYVPALQSGRIGAPRLALSDPAVKSVAALALPVAFGLAIFQVNVLMDNLIAEILVPGDGAVSALYFGNRLMQFPLGVVGVAIATAVFPHLAALGARSDISGLRRIMEQSLRNTFFLAIPAGAGLMLLSPGIVSLLFGHGEFSQNPDALHRTALVTLLYGAGLPAYCGLQVATRGFYSLKDTRTPLWISTAMVLVNLAGNLALVFPMREAGLALSTAATAWLNFFICLVFLGKKVEAPWIRIFLRGAARPAAASILMCAAAYGVNLLAEGLPFPGKAVTAAAVLSAVAAGALVYMAAAYATGDQSLRQWAAALASRRRRPADEAAAAPIIVSACLMGRPCRWDGKAAPSARVAAAAAGVEAIEICPEVDGGLGVPRPRAVMLGGTGCDVAEGRARIVFKDTGQDVTEAFLKGAREAERTARERGVKLAYLKSRSPSCGVGKVSIDGEIVPGDGVAAWLLMKLGVECREVDADPGPPGQGGTGGAPDPREGLRGA